MISRLRKISQVALGISCIVQYINLTSGSLQRSSNEFLMVFPKRQYALRFTFRSGRFHGVGRVSPRMRSLKGILRTICAADGFSLLK